MVELVIRRERKQTEYYTEDLGNGIGLDMVLVPGGRFLMGSPEDELERRDNEGPQHEVSVPMLFVGRYPVTQSQWKAVAALPKIDRKLTSDPSRFKGDDRPVERVFWDDAMEFCARLVQTLPALLAVCCCITLHE